MSPRAAKLTFHQDLLNLLAQLLHGSLGQIVALLGLLKPFIESGIGPQVGGARSRYVRSHVMAYPVAERSERVRRRGIYVYISARRCKAMR